MPTYKLVVSYDGTGFVGWQRQAAGTSIQGLLEDALADLVGGPVAIAGAGRTDAGVHAIAQAASFSIARDIEAAIVARAMNARLPAAVRVVAAERASDRFHARFAARSKTYRYRIWNAAVLDPFERAYTWHVAGELAVPDMDAAARLLEGTHDFAAFQAGGSGAHSTEREVTRSRVARQGPLVAYEVDGNGFLRHMVRNIVGSLVEVGRRRHGVEWLGDVLASRSRAAAGPTAPPEGLFLASVSYAPEAASPCG